MKSNKIVLIAISLLLIITLTACGSNNIKTPKKFALTKENVQKVFNNTYDVGIYSISDENKNISAVFNPKQNIPKSKAKEKLAQVENILHKDFNISNDNSIEIEIKGHPLIKDSHGTIQIGEAPVITFKAPALYFNDYSMSTKFDLLSPVEGSKITATDSEDGDLTTKIKLKNSDVLNKIGKQTLIYEVTDSDGNTTINNEINIMVKK